MSHQSTVDSNKPMPECTHILFTDQAEYSIVCAACYSIFSSQQWSGSTRGRKNWRENAYKALQDRQLMNGDCEFCGVEHGSGGWGVSDSSSEGRYSYPAAEQRDQKRIALGWKPMRECIKCDQPMRVLVGNEHIYRFDKETPETCQHCGTHNNAIYPVWYRPDGTRHGKK